MTVKTIRTPAIGQHVQPWALGRWLIRRVWTVGPSLPRFGLVHAWCPRPFGFGLLHGDRGVAADK